MTPKKLRDEDDGILLLILSVVLIVSGAITFYWYSWLFGIIGIILGFIACTYSLLFTELKNRILYMTKN